MEETEMVENNDKKDAGMTPTPPEALTLPAPPPPPLAPEEVPEEAKDEVKRTSTQDIATVPAPPPPTELTPPEIPPAPSEEIKPVEVEEKKEGPPEVPEEPSEHPPKIEKPPEEKEVVPDRVGAKEVETEEYMEEREAPQEVGEEEGEGPGEEIRAPGVRFSLKSVLSPFTKITESFRKRKRLKAPAVPDELQVKVRKVPRNLKMVLPPENWELQREYEIKEGVSRIRIYLNPITSSYVYWVIEPTLSEVEKEMLGRIKDLLQVSLPYSLEAVEEGKRKSFLMEHLSEVISDYNLKIPENSLEKLRYYVVRDFLGFNRIDPIMHDPNVEDISCDGPGIPIYLYHRDYGSIKTNVIFTTDDEVDSFVVSLAQKCRKTISVANPILDATLPDGSRLNATYGREITTRGSSFTIRKFREEPLTVVDLVENNTMSPEMAAHFWLAVQYGESMIFAGGTASGKTSTMNAISIFIPPSSKIISIEDTREVNLPHENWIAGITRGGAEAERPGDIGMYDLLRAALRQRPEYVIVGEVRGKETMTMFQAMATGHTTYSTMHADSVKSIVYRLENPPIGIPRVLIQALNLVAIHKQLKVKEKRVRRITELVEIVDIEPTTLEIVTNQVFKWNPRTDTFVYGGHSNLYEKIMDLEDLSRDNVLEERERRAEIIKWMVSNGVRKFRDVARVVGEYYEDPSRTLSIIEKNPEVVGNPLEIFERAAREGRKQKRRENDIE